jgi:hypothetical protein
MSRPGLQCGLNKKSHQMTVSASSLEMSHSHSSVHHVFPSRFQSFYPHKYTINFDSCEMTDTCQGQPEWNTTVGIEGEISCPIIPTIQGICFWGLLTISSYDILLFHSSVVTNLRRWAKREKSGWKVKMPSAKGCMIVPLHTKHACRWYSNLFSQ